jgi:hypothetical protein
LSLAALSSKELGALCFKRICSSFYSSVLTFGDSEMGTQVHTSVGIGVEDASWESSSC